MQHEQHQRQVEQALSQIPPPTDISIRAWDKSDFAAIQQLSSTEGWPTPARRPEDALAGWHTSWPTLVAIEADQIVGFVRAITDGAITMYIMELLVDPSHRGRGIGRSLLDTCHLLYPRVRIDVTSTETSQSFYAAYGFRFIGPGMRKSYV